MILDREYAQFLGDDLHQKGAEAWSIFEADLGQTRDYA